jgi:RNA polymerase sigma-70 factor (ECF subfamily)
MVEVAEDAAETTGPAAGRASDRPERRDDETRMLGRDQPGREPPASQSFAEEAIDHLDTLYRGALRLTRDPAQAEDLVQDTYLRALRYQSSYQAGTNMKAWLFAIMRNLFWDRFKGGRPEDVSLDGDGEVSLYDTLRDETAMPEAEVLDRIAADEVVRAVERLPELHREVVLLVDVEGFSYRDAAEVLGVPIGTVMSRLHRARRQLQKALYEYARESGIVHTDGDR